MELMWLAVFVAGMAVGMVYGMWVADDWWKEKRNENS